MSGYDVYDLLNELVELCRDLQSDIKQQLVYYRASVYKAETASVIDQKLDQLKLVVEVLGCDETLDHFTDFEATRGNGNIALAPGECLLTWRISELFASLDQAYHQLLADTHTAQGARLVRGAQKYRRKLVSLCPAGSRKRSFFEAL